jgi:hypothetical protein
LKEGKRNTATKQLLAQVLGLDSLPDDEDHDDVEEDAHFDPNAFDVERRKAREALEEEEADEDSSRSSQATLVDMSSVELEIGKDELAALSDPENEDDDEDDDDDSRRKSRRIRKHDSTNASSGADPGRFDESNIVEGKRGRKPVDYKKLNEAIFGDLPDAEAAKIDDTDDFEMKETRKKVLASSDDESGEEDDEDEKKDGDEDEQISGTSEEEPSRKKSRKHEPPTEDEDDSNAPKEDRKKAAKAAKREKAAPSSTAATPRSNGAKGKQAKPSIAQAALSMVSKLVGGGQKGMRRKR